MKACGRVLPMNFCYYSKFALEKSYAGLIFRGISVFQMTNNWEEIYR
jgi:hypothetical protein